MFPRRISMGSGRQSAAAVCHNEQNKRKTRRISRHMRAMMPSVLCSVTHVPTQWNSEPEMQISRKQSVRNRRIHGWNSGAQSLFAYGIQSLHSTNGYTIRPVSPITASACPKFFIMGNALFNSVGTALLGSRCRGPCCWPMKRYQQ